MMVSGIAYELSKCGLLADHYYFVSRWFSGSVLVMAHLWARMMLDAWCDHYLPHQCWI